jgi:hypothetical protein
MASHPAVRAHHFLIGNAHVPHRTAALLRDLMRQFVFTISLTRRWTTVQLGLAPCKSRFGVGACAGRARGWVDSTEELLMDLTVYCLGDE